MYLIEKSLIDFHRESLSGGDGDDKKSPILALLIFLIVIYYQVAMETLETYFFKLSGFFS